MWYERFVQALSDVCCAKKPNHPGQGPLERKFREEDRALRTVQACGRSDPFKSFGPAPQSGDAAKATDAGACGGWPPAAPPAEVGAEAGGKEAGSEAAGSPTPSALSTSASVPEACAAAPFEAPAVAADVRTSLDCQGGGATSSADAAASPALPGAEDAQKPSSKQKGVAAVLKAVRSGSRASVTKLLATEGVREMLNEADKHGVTPLSAACAIFNTELVQALLAARADPNHPDEEGVAPLHLAAMSSSPGLLQALLQAGAAVNAADADGYTALILVAGSHNTAPPAEKVRAVAELLAHRADPTIEASDGATALTAADSASVLELLEGSAPARTRRRGRRGGVRGHGQDLTNLHLAAMAGDTEALMKAFEEGTDKDAPDKDDRTPLMYAAASGHATVVDALCQLGVNVNLQSHGGETALALATLRGADALVESLLAARASTSLSLLTGRTPLHLAAERGHVSTARCLVAARADLSSPDTQGETPLTLAFGKRELLDAMVSAAPPAPKRGSLADELIQADPVLWDGKVPRLSLEGAP